jgi:hypothetical protein
LDPEGQMTLHKFKKIMNVVIPRHPEATENKLSEAYVQGTTVVKRGKSFVFIFNDTYKLQLTTKVILHTN